MQHYTDLALFNYIITACKKHLISYHFAEINTPIIVPTELSRRLPRTTDDKTQDALLYIANKEEINNESLCLRNSAIPSMATLYNREPQSHVPWKVYTHGPMFTSMPHAKPAYTQTNHIDLSIIGCHTATNDVQLITMLDRFFSRTLPLNGYVLALNILGCSEDQKAYLKKLHLFLQSNKAEGLCDSCKTLDNDRSMNIFGCKNTACQKILQNAPRIIDNLCEPCAQDWAHIQEQLDLLSVTHTWQPALMPAQKYLNKVIFEFASTQPGTHMTFCNGGHCDNLVGIMGGSTHPALAASLNVDNLIKLIQPYKDKLPLEQAPALNVILPLGAEQHMLALLLADTLHAQGLCIDVLLESDSLKSMLRHANTMGAAFCLILGPQEQQERKVTVKNMITGAEDTIEQTEAYAYLTR